VTLLSTLTVVVGPTAARTCFAACCGVSAEVGAGIGLAVWAGTVISVTESVVLCHSHTVLPPRTTSVSLSDDGTASR
jgi:hypothetical protein